ncbi:unnamed protein product [Calicophoron daubneyi]|uniref:Transforming acidic coiled-coil-containing protein C-terminal domain-containing protein n=1 Tax=Calicophoron daubneyi TaxID=300641 RepID=A0AAV2SYV7_CALDB
MSINSEAGSLVDDAVDSVILHTSDNEVHWHLPNIRLHCSTAGSGHSGSDEPSSLMNTQHDSNDKINRSSNVISTSDVNVASVLHSCGYATVESALDSLEARTDQPNQRAPDMADSLLVDFDPLAPTGLKNPDMNTTNPIENMSQSAPKVLINNFVDENFESVPVGHLISPLGCEAGADLPVNGTASVLTDSGSRLSTGFTPIPLSRHVALTKTASPGLFSPWRHNSILDQALGGGERSPEWSFSIAQSQAYPGTGVMCQHPRNLSESKSVESLECRLSCVEGDDLDETKNYQTPLSDNNAGTAVQEINEVDALASLVKRVLVDDHSPITEQNAMPSDQFQPLVMEENASNALERLAGSPTELQKPKDANPPGTYNVNRKRATENADITNTPPLNLSPHKDGLTPPLRRLTMNLNKKDVISTHHIIPEVSVDHTDSCCHDSGADFNNRSTRLSIGSLTGIVSMAARSIYDRLGGSSHPHCSPVQTPAVGEAIGYQDIRVPDDEESEHSGSSKSGGQHVSETSSSSTESTEVKQAIFTTSVNDNCVAESEFQLQADHPDRYSQPVNEAVVSSVDEDVWESVDSIADVPLTTLGSLKKSDELSMASSLSVVPVDICENKENIEFFQVAESELGGQSQQEHIHSQSIVGSTDRLPSPSTISRNGLHESQLTQNLNASGDGPELLQKSVGISDQVSYEAEILQLKEQTSTLQSVIDSLSTIITGYEKSLLDVEASMREDNQNASIHLMQIAQERDEAIDQARTVYKAYEDMLRRVQRSRETIESMRQRQESNLRLIEKYENRSILIRDRTESLNQRLSDRLAQTVQLQCQQSEEWNRKLGKLELKLRQSELRNSTLTQQIEQETLKGEELRKMSYRFFE